MRDVGIFSRPCNFLMGAKEVEKMPASVLPEIAFAGRSNVGKSTIINALFHRKNLARTSKTPGRTAMLNLFQLDEIFTLVDMPGYGYAKVEKTLRQEWKLLIQDYFRSRATLRRVFILVDARRGIGEQDEHMMQLCDDSAISYQCILTKADTIKKDELAELQKQSAEKVAQFRAGHPLVIATSSKNGTGMDDLRHSIIDLL